jgi:hypothetical protein
MLMLLQQVQACWLHKITKLNDTYNTQYLSMFRLRKNTIVMCRISEDFFHYDPKSIHFAGKLSCHLIIDSGTFSSDHEFYHSRRAWFGLHFHSLQKIVSEVD